jgi:hypothetical protein
MEDITVKLDGKKYLQVTIPVGTSEATEAVNTLEAEGAIIRSITHKGSMWSGQYWEVTYLKRIGKVK